MTYNIANHLTLPERVVDALKRSEAAIIALQELAAPQADAIQRDLAEVYPYQLLYGEGIRGKGLLSRYPITSSERLRLYPGRPDLLAHVLLDDRPLRIIVAHPIPPRLQKNGIYFTDRTNTHVNSLLTLATSGEPTILMGDFNMSVQHPHHAALTQAGLFDSFLEVGYGNGFTVPRRIGRMPAIPVSRIDYIWHTAHLRAERAWVGQDAGSDHLPVMARLSWV